MGDAELLDFIVGYPGPPAVPFLDVELRVIALLLYRDCVRIEYLVTPWPDAAGHEMNESELFERLARVPEEHRVQAEASLRVWALLGGYHDSARLTDDLGTRYTSATPSGARSTSVGRVDHLTFRPTAPSDARLVTLHLGAIDIAIPINERAANCD